MATQILSNIHDVKPRGRLLPRQVVVMQYVLDGRHSTLQHLIAGSHTHRIGYRLVTHISHAACLSTLQRSRACLTAISIIFIEV